MSVVRWLFLLACLSCFAIVACNGRWEARLTDAKYTTIVDLGRSPLWAPPPVPTHARFRDEVEDSEAIRKGRFPSESSSRGTIVLVLRLDWMAVDLLLYLWPVTVVAGLLYLAGRGKRRDLILHLGLSAGIGLTVAAVTCVGVWMLYGGWGPPDPESYGGYGLLLGILVGLISFRWSKGHSEREN
jgi:hypothetical protein